MMKNHVLSREPNTSYRPRRRNNPVVNQSYQLESFTDFSTGHNMNLLKDSIIIEKI